MKTIFIFLLLTILGHTVTAQNVGINITNPQATLDVRGNHRFGGINNFISYDSASGKIGWTNSHLYLPNNQQLIQHSASAEGLFYNNSALEYRNQFGNTVFSTNWNNGIGYFGGNVGISNTLPRFPMSFSGELGEKISFWDDGNLDSASYGIGVQPGLLQIHTYTNGDNIGFGSGSSKNFTEVMRIKSNGNVGIGTTSPSAKFEIAGGSLKVSSESTVVANFMYIGTTPTTSASGISSICESLGIYSEGSGTGVYGQGSENGVYGVATLIGGGNRYGVNALGKGGTSNNVGLYGLGIGGQTAAGVYGSGSYGITNYGVYGVATGGTNNWAGYFSGNVYTTGIYQSSDRKLKNDIKTLSGALSIINQLNPSVYTYKTNDYKQMQLPEGIHYGLIADEVQQVIPGAVKKAVQPAEYENHDSHHGKKLSDAVEFDAVNYTEMIPVLIAGMKEQQVIIENQNKKIDQQQQQINNLVKEIQLIKEKLH